MASAHFEKETSMDKRDFLKAAVLPIVAQPANAILASSAFAQPAVPAAATQRLVEANGIRINITEQGSGPVVLLCHGFPETSYSWRHQLPALAAAGFHAVAPDMRGYGKSDRPEAIDQYSIFHIIGDLIGVLDALGAKNAVVVGHDVGATVAWIMAQMRPDRVRAVVALSVPYRPRSPVRPTSAMPRTADAQFYQLYFQQPGVAEAEFESDPRMTVRNMLFGASGDGVAAARAAASAQGGAGPNLAMVPNGGRFMRGAAAPEKLPSWLTEADIDAYASDFKRTGFRGALNYYRNLDRNWEIQGALAGAPVAMPALYVAGDRDFIVSSPGVDQLLANFKRFVPALQKVQMLPGCGHWTQQERPQEVNAALLGFLAGLAA
jgi:pimeloyl-ACP methyl ester carboxylesterase